MVPSSDSRSFGWRCRLCPCKLIGTGYTITGVMPGAAPALLPTAMMYSRD